MNRRRLGLCAAILFGLLFAVGLTSACQEQAEYRGMRPVSARELSQATVISPTEVVWEMLGQVNRERALSDLRRFTGEEPMCAGTDCYTITNRLTGSEGLQRTTDYISKELASLGYPVSFQNWSGLDIQIATDRQKT
jgi:hypothetical protein